MTDMTALGLALGALPKEGKERLTVRVDTDTFAVYPENGKRQRIGTVMVFTTNEGARTPSGGKFVSRRILVTLKDDPNRKWVGQFKNDEKTKVILRPLPVSKEKK